MALVQEALEENGFEVTPINDPSSEDLKKIFDLFVSLYGRDPENRLLIYFAGQDKFKCKLTAQRWATCSH